MFQTLITLNLRVITLIFFQTGFYRSKYYNQAESATKYLAVTQFESHYARQAFPCLDEPDMKAKFTVKLTTKKGKPALLNIESK